MNLKLETLHFKILLNMVKIFFLCSISYGAKIAEFPQPRAPHFITIDKGRLFILDGYDKIHIFKFERNRIQFQKTIGKKGQGPGEFLGLKHLLVKDKHIEVPTMGKYIRFTLDGEFIDETKITFMSLKNKIYRVGKNYLSIIARLDPKEMIAQIQLYGPTQKLLKELGKKQISYGTEHLNIAAPYYSMGVNKDKIYIIYSDHETVVKLYDQNGNPSNEIKLPLEHIKFTPELKEKVEYEFRGDMNEEGWNFFKKYIYIPAYAPGLNYFEIFGNIMVARTYLSKEGKAEFVFFDEKGKELKRMFLYDSGRIKDGIPFCFFEGNFYYMKENPETENWELFSEKVIY